nr:uncharacterized protein LOC109729735 [Microcebus murinus]
MPVPVESRCAARATLKPQRLIPPDSTGAPVARPAPPKERQPLEQAFPRSAPARPRDSGAQGARRAGPGSRFCFLPAVERATRRPPPWGTLRAAPSSAGAGGEVEAAAGPQVGSRRPSAAAPATLHPGPGSKRQGQRRGRKTKRNFCPRFLRSSY